VKKVFLYGVIEIGTEATGTFKVNGLRLKHYIVNEWIDGEVNDDLPDAISS